MTENNNNLPAAHAASPAKALTVFGSIQGFEDAQRMTKALCASSLVPEDYRGQNGSANALIALEMSQRVGVSPLAVMQNLHIIQGRPSWSSAFIIASLNSCGRFSPLRYIMEDLGAKTVEVETWVGPKGQRRKEKKKVELQNLTCQVWANDKTGERLEGPTVTMEMAALEGWLTKNDSKWQTMPDLMLRYRAAAFFGRLYAPDILMGMHSADEAEDMPPVVVDVTPPPLATDIEPEPLATVEAEVVDAEVVSEETATKETSTKETFPEEVTEHDRNAIKAELDALGIDYQSRAATKTLVKLLEEAQAMPAEEDTNQAGANEEPPPLAAVEQAEETADNQGQGTKANEGSAPKDLF